MVNSTIRLIFFLIPHKKKVSTGSVAETRLIGPEHNDRAVEGQRPAARRFNAGDGAEAEAVRDGAEVTAVEGNC